ncbi:MAG: hypothetical protein B7X95_05230 [Methylophilaceae bacterium 17-44-8]|nr:MAG: hypothetical protein B7X95_05230 [Methylophilaceae bacterium 17-44-8]
MDILPGTSINQFLERLTTLTKERDGHELEQTLKQTISSLVELFTNTQAKSVRIYRLKEISTLFFSAVSEDQINV